MQEFYEARPEPAPLKVVCAWCPPDPNAPPNPDPGSRLTTSHGICPTCAATHFPSCRRNRSHE